MSDEPLNHTTILANVGFSMDTMSVIIEYAAYPVFEHLPKIARTDETRREHDAWWAWKEAQDEKR